MPTLTFGTGHQARALSALDVAFGEEFRALTVVQAVRLIEDLDLLSSNEDYSTEAAAMVLRQRLCHRGELAEGVVGRYVAGLFASDEFEAMRASR